MANDGGCSLRGCQFNGVNGRKATQRSRGRHATPDGKEYRLVASDGGIFAFGDARYFGLMGRQNLNAPMVESRQPLWRRVLDGGA